MTAGDVFKKLARGGGYSLPYLVRLYQVGYTPLYYVNNNEDVEFGGQVYKAASFKYTRPKQKNGVLTNGSLEITSLNDVLDMIEAANDLFEVQVVGVLDGDEVTPLKIFHHRYGSITSDESMKVTITFSNDDRLQMVFPPYTFDTNNNRGNA